MKNLIGGRGGIRTHGLRLSPERIKQEIGGRRLIQAGLLVHNIFSLIIDSFQFFNYLR